MQLEKAQQLKALAAKTDKQKSAPQDGWKELDSRSRISTHVYAHACTLGVFLDHSIHWAGAHKGTRLNSALGLR